MSLNFLHFLCVVSYLQTDQVELNATTSLYGLTRQGKKQSRQSSIKNCVHLKACVHMYEVQTQLHINLAKRSFDSENQSIFIFFSLPFFILFLNQRKVNRLLVSNVYKATEQLFSGCLESW